MELLTPRDLLTIATIAVLFMSGIVGAHLLYWPLEADARRAGSREGGITNPVALPVRYAIGAGLHGLCFTIGVISLEAVTLASALILYWTTWIPGGLAIIILHALRAQATERAERARKAGSIRDILHGGENHHGKAAGDPGD